MPPLAESGGQEKTAGLRRLRPALQVPELLRFFFYVDFYFGGYVAEDFYRYGIFAESFDGFLELELALVDFEILRGEGVGDVAGGYGAEELVVLAGLAGAVQRDAVDDGGLLLRGVRSEERRVG